MAQLIGLIIAGAAGFWVFNDANSRGMNPWVWAIFTFLLLIIGLPVYLITRKPKIDGED